MLRLCAHHHCEQVIAKLSGGLCVYCPGLPSVLRMRACGGDLSHDVWQACQDMIQRNSTGPQFSSRLVTLAAERVVANKTVNFVVVEHALLIFLGQDFVPAADVFHLRIVLQLYVMLAVGF